MDQRVKDGITALKAGDKARAQQLFVAALQDNNDDLQAWLWLSGAVENNTDRLECLEQVIRIDPNHDLAARGIAKLKARGIHLPEKPAPEASAESVEAAAPAARMEPLEWETFENNQSTLTVESYTAGERTATAEPVEAPPLAGLEQFQEGEPNETANAEPMEAPALAGLEQFQESEPNESAQSLGEEEKRAERPLEKIILKTKPSIIPVLMVGILISAAAVALVSLLFPWAEKISSMDPFVLFMSLLVVLALLIGAIAVRILQHLFTRYILTNRRLIIEDSLVSRAQKSIPLGKIQGISYRQNLLERIFRLGTVMLAANGESGPVYLHDLKEYLDLAERIETASTTHLKD